MTVTSASCLLVLLLVPGLSFAPPLPGVKKDEAGRGSTELELRLKATGGPKGTPVRWEAVIVNRGKRTLTLVQAGGGSEDGYRTPILQWVVDGKVPNEVRKPEAAAAAAAEEKGKDKPDELRPVQIASGRKCGNINALKASEVVDLAPGQQLKIDWMNWPEVPEGTHKLRLRYFNLPELKWQGIPLGEHDAKAMARVRGSHRVALESNEVRVTVGQPVP